MIYFNLEVLCVNMFVYHIVKIRRHVCIKLTPWPFNTLMKVKRLKCKIDAEINLVNISQPSQNEYTPNQL